MAGFPAYRIFDEDGRVGGRIVELDVDDLDQGDVLIRTRYAGVNYKDALAGTGRAKVLRRYPCVGGIEAVGTVAASRSGQFREGDAVIVHGRGIGVAHDGGFSSYLRVPADWVLALPTGLTMLEAATLGVAGHTAAIAIDAMEVNGLRPDRGPVAVTGGTGGVASLAIDMLDGLGYEVTAVSRKPDADEYLRKLGARQVMPTPEPAAPAKPLERAIWAGAVDSAGGHVLGWLLRTMAPNGTVASFGNAAGVDLHTTVLPLILRGVRLLGINADTEMPYRRAIWERLATDLKPRHLSDIVTTIALQELPDLMIGMIEGRTRGRHVVAFE